MQTLEDVPLLKPLYNAYILYYTGLFVNRQSEYTAYGDNGWSEIDIVNIVTYSSI